MAVDRPRGRAARDWWSGWGLKPMTRSTNCSTQPSPIRPNIGPVLPVFLTWFDAGTGDLKRDSDSAKGQVRVMTVHGSKGLQAPIVILADATGAPGDAGDLGAGGRSARRRSQRRARAARCHLSRPCRRTNANGPIAVARGDRQGASRCRNTGGCFMSR